MMEALCIPILTKSSTLLLRERGGKKDRKGKRKQVLSLTDTRHADTDDEGQKVASSRFAVFAEVFGKVVDQRKQLVFAQSLGAGKRSRLQAL